MNRTLEGIHSVISKRGLWLRVDRINDTYTKIVASRIESHLPDGFIYILDNKKDRNIIRTLYYSEYKDTWACEKDEFRPTIFSR